jgi:hypothetical protein
MRYLIHIVTALLASYLKSRAALQLENIALRHQNSVLRRSAPNRLHLNRWDRMIFATLYRLWPKIVGSIAIVRPRTVARWHKQGFRLCWRWKCGSNGGRPRVPQELRGLIHEMSQANPLWGAPRIHGELLKLGIEVGQATVARYMISRPRPPGQDWKTFLHNHMNQTAATDFFVVPTISFKLLFGMVVVDHARRKILHVAVTAHPTAEWTARQLT